LTHTTKQRLLDTGQAMLLRHGYHDLGIQAVLSATESEATQATSATSPHTA